MGQGTSNGSGLDSLPLGFNRIEASTFDLLANQDGFVTRESLKKAAQNPNLDEVQKDDVQHMLKNFKFLTKEFNDNARGKFGISREDIAKYNFTADFKFLEFRLSLSFFFVQNSHIFSKKYDCFGLREKWTSLSLF